VGSAVPLCCHSGSRRVSNLQGDLAWASSPRASREFPGEVSDHLDVGGEELIGLGIHPT